MDGQNCISLLQVVHEETPSVRDELLLLALMNDLCSPTNQIYVLLRILYLWSFCEYEKRNGPPLKRRCMVSIHDLAHKSKWFIEPLDTNASKQIANLRFR